MTHLRLIQLQMLNDVMLVELQDSIGASPDYTLLDEFEVIRGLRRSIGCSKVILDLGKPQLFGSVLLELIRVFWNDISAAGGQLILCNPTKFGREVLSIAKFDQVWTIADSRAAAIALFNQMSHQAAWPESLQASMTLYERGPQLLREAIQGLSSIQLRTPSPPGVWSTLQIVCHIADFELVYADRMKRVIAEDQPTMFGGDPDTFAAKLAYTQRDLAEELSMIAAVRQSTARFLKTLSTADFDRTGIHSSDGPLTLATLLSRIAGHIPHHVQLIEGKKQNLLHPQPK